MELGYRQFELEDSLSTDTFIDETEYLEEEWEVNINAKQLSLMPTYSYHFNDKWKLKGGVGVTYTQYEQSSEYSTELENIYDEDILDSETSLSERSEQEQWCGFLRVKMMVMNLLRRYILNRIDYKLPTYTRYHSRCKTQQVVR